MANDEEITSREFPIEYSIREEIVNSITHGIGTLTSIAGLALLLVFSIPEGDPWKISSFLIYGISLILMHLSSTLYHSIRNYRFKRFLQLADHGSIFLLIAGTYTPFLLVPLRGLVGWILFSIVWFIAFAGVIYKTYYINK